MPGAKGRRVTAKSHEGTIWAGANILNLDCGDGNMSIRIQIFVRIY